MAKNAKKAAQPANEQPASTIQTPEERHPNTTHDDGETLVIDNTNHGQVNKPAATSGSTAPAKSDAPAEPKAPRDTVARVRQAIKEGKTKAEIVAMGFNPSTVSVQAGKLRREEGIIMAGSAPKTKTEPTAEGEVKSAEQTTAEAGQQAPAVAQ